MCAQNVYAISPTWQLTLLGTIAPNTTPVSMADNGTTLILVDGTTSGYTINLETNAFAPLVDPTGAFVGADRVRYLDTFFIFNKPGTQDFYISLSNSTTFDPLYIAGKVGYADNLITIEVMHRELWLIGEKTTEVWYDSGAADFPFQLVPGAFIQHGCVAKDSVCTQDLAVFWISADLQGSAIVLMGSNYNVERISTHAIEHEFATYSTVSDAIGYVYQEEGHMFYVLNFPTADRTWVYDISQQLWHERAYLDSNGVEHRHRSNVFAHAYNTYVVGDWQNGNLYALDQNNYTDNGASIKRVRSFPHVVNELKRVIYNKFVADMQTGADLDPNASVPQISLRWSDDRGASWSNPVTQSLGSVGQFSKIAQFRRLGMSRDRVFELSWSAPVMTALNGALVDVQECAS